MPKVEKIIVERKFSKCIRRDGLEEWHGVTHTAEATPLQGETYEMAEQILDEQVRKGLVQAYAPMRRGSQRAQEAVGDEEIEEPPVDPLVKAAPEMGGVPAPVDPSWCAIHEAKMKMRSWGGYSHKIGEQWCQGHWCLEHDQPFKKFEKSGGTWWSHSHQDPDSGEELWCREDGEQGEILSQ